MHTPRLDMRFNVVGRLLDLKFCWIFAEKLSAVDVHMRINMVNICVGQNFFDLRPKLFFNLPHELWII